MPGNDRRGIALLEAMIALAILSTGGMTAVALTRSGMQSAEHAAESEVRVMKASQTLAATSLLTRGELDQRIGRHNVGEFLVYVSRPEPTLYRIALAAQESPEHEELVTVVHRPAKDAR